MTTKHTPGPWHSGLLLHKIIARPLLGDDAVAIASIGGRSEEELQANARLIAAAPDLLAALQEIAEHAIANNHGSFNVSADRVRGARAVIAKAKGEV